MQAASIQSAPIDRIHAGDSQQGLTARQATRLMAKLSEQYPESRFNLGRYGAGWAIYTQAHPGEIIDTPCAQDAGVTLDLFSAPQPVIASNDAYTETPDQAQASGDYSARFVASAVAGYALTDDALVTHRGPVAAFDANLHAIATLRSLQASDSGVATPSQADALAGFVGWGACAEVFDPKHEQHTTRRGTLLSDLGNEGFRHAERGVLSSYFTPPAVIRGLYRALEHAGFQGGRVLEPSCGSGLFFSCLPDSLRDKCDLYAVELDPTTGQIARALHPQARIGAGRGFESIPVLPPLDLCIGNPPFGQTKVFDPSNPDLSWLSIHNFFLVKSLRMLRPGALLAFVISRHFLDAENTKARQAVADMADLVAAVRLPSDAFSGTEAVADVVVFQRRGDDTDSPQTDWIDTDYASAENGVDYLLNSFYHNRPEAVLGRVESIFNGAMKLRGEADADLEALVADGLCQQITAPLNLPEPQALDEQGDVDGQVVPSECGAEPYCYFELPDGRFGRRLPDIASLDEDEGMIEQWEEVTLDGAKPRARMRALIALRQHTLALVRLEREDADEADIEKARSTLNSAYDQFVAKHGYIHHCANSRVFRRDGRWSLLLALETDFDAGVSKAVGKRDGITPRKPSAGKAKILSERVTFPAKTIEHADSIEDAISLSCACRGGLDIDYMAGLLGKDRAEVLGALSDLAYESPVTGRWYLAEEYGSGDIKAKLRPAEQAAANEPERYGRNVAFLSACLPEPIKADAINVGLQARWLPNDLREAFIEHLAGSGSCAKVTFDSATDSFDVSISGADAVRCTDLYGTDAAPLTRIVNAILTQNAVKVTREIQRPDGSVSRVVDPEETLAAQEKVLLVKDEFEDWLWSDVERRERVEAVYNDTFNRFVERQYDGSHLTRASASGTGLAGMSKEIVLRTQQLNGSWRFLCQRGGLADHVVGAGKTFLAACVAMELRRLGLAKTVMAVVPNHLVDQWAGEWQRLFPSARLLVASKQDFEKTRRGEFFCRIATEDWDGVIVPMSSFELIPPPWDTMQNLVREEVTNLSSALLDMNEGMTKKRLEARKAKLEQRLDSIIHAKQKQMALEWDDLGIDFCIIDEAHLYKNLYFSTAQSDVAGLGNPEGSQRAFDLLAKVRHIQNNQPGIGALFLTGTPIANSMAELYTHMRYLVPGELEKMGVEYFDAWAAAFGEITTEYELDATGVGYALKRRFAKFVNMPELMALYRQFADVVLREDLHRLAEQSGRPINIPSERNGGPINVVVERSPAQKAYMDWLVHRAVHNCSRGGRDNMLRITYEARMIGLDPRTLIPGCPDDQGGKLEQAAENILAEYRQWDWVRGTQLVFCDLAVPRAPGATPRNLALHEFCSEPSTTGDMAKAILADFAGLDYAGGDFTAYDALRQLLVDGGIPADQIAFMHDYRTDRKKEILFERVRQGDVRVLLGSTQLMGTGMNVQDRIVAVHHLDAPWRPADLEQRDGRAKRSGNLILAADPSFTQAFYRYATQRTYDARMWQVLASKSRFIAQARQGAKGIREMDDVSSEVASAEEMKASASGNPLILEEVRLRGDIVRLRTLKRRHGQSQRRMQDTINHYPARSQRMRDNIAAIRTDLANVGDKDAQVVVEGQTHQTHAEAGFAFVDAYRRNRPSRYLEGQGKVFAKIGRFGVRAFATRFSEGLEVIGEGGIAYQIHYDRRPLKSGSGAITRVRNLIGNLGEALAHAEGDLKRLEQAHTTCQDAYGKPFERADELAEMESRHMEILAQLDRNTQADNDAPEDQQAA